MTETPLRAPAPPGLLYAMARQRQDQLDARENLASAELRRTLSSTEARLYAQLEQVTDLILATPPEQRSPAWLYQQARYRELIAQVDQEMAAFGGEAARTVTEAQRWAQVQGGQDAAALGAQAAGLRAGDFLGTNMANLSAAAGFMADGTPLSELFGQYGTSAKAMARQVLSDAVTLGWGSAKTARQFRERVVGMPARRAELIARTELHRVYRSTSRDVYAANSDVLTGWVWLAKLDARTCSTCIVMSGTFHPVEETLDGHPRCRCAMVPITGPWQAIDPRLAELKNTTAQVPTGADWLRAQPPAVQKAVLGPGKYDLYRRGQIDLQDLVKRDSHPDWGTMRREATILEARAAAAARGVRQVISRKGRTLAQQRADREALRRAAPPKLAPPKPVQLNRPTVDVDLPREQLELAMRQAPKGTQVTFQGPSSMQTWTKATDSDKAAARWNLEGGDRFAWETSQRLSYRVAEARRPALPDWGPNPRVRDLEARLARLDAVNADPKLRADLRTLIREAEEEWDLRRAYALRTAHRAPELARMKTLPPSATTRAAVQQPNTNPRYGEPGYGVNCTHVVQAYELRRRGYDVEATELPEAMRPGGGRQTAALFGRNWTHADGTPVGERDMVYTPNITALRNEVKSWPEGGRGTVRISWQGGGGHVFNVEKLDGKAVFTEAQSSGPDKSADYWLRAKASNGKRHLWVIRMDDKLPTPGLIDELDPTIRPAG